MGAYGNTVSIGKNAIKFQDFTLRLQEFNLDGSPSTVSASYRVYEIQDNAGKIQKITVTFGQFPPSPTDFKVGPHTFTLFTYELPKGERLFPTHILIQKTSSSKK